MKSIFLLLIILFLTISCNPNMEMPKFIANDLDKYNKIIVIPFSGCSGCGTEAIEYMRNYNKYPKVLFIITDIRHLKETKIKLNQIVNLDEASNIVLDDHNEMKKLIEIGIYPILFEIKNQEVFKIKEASNGRFEINP